MRYQRILLTGASGFVGRALLRKFKELSLDVLAVGNDNAERCIKPCDLTDGYAVRQMVESFRPEIVLHLAAVSNVTSDPARTWEVNFEGTRNLVSSLRKFGAAPMIFASSTEIYGGAFADGLAKDETSPVQPKNTYARSKLAAESLLEETYAPIAPVISLRLGNHSGAGQGDGAVIPAFASQIAQIELSGRPGSMLYGNLENERQFMDIDDVVDAYLRAMDLMPGISGFKVYNVSSDTPIKVSKVLSLLLERSSVPVSADLDLSKPRANDIPRAFADASAFKKATGWSCDTPLEDTVTDVLNDWRNRKWNERGFSAGTAA